MSFCRFCLLRGRQGLVGGLARPMYMLNGMPLVHQRLSGGGFSKAFDNVGTSVVTKVVGVGVTGIVGYKVYQWKQEYDEKRKFQKFLKGHHVPSPPVRYEIQRTEVEKQVTDDILRKARANQVVNIVGMFCLLSVFILLFVVDKTKLKQNETKY